METTNLKELVTESIRYWEPRRVLYNAVLSAIVITYFVLALPGSKRVLTVDFFLSLFILAVLANVAYCAAYVVDIFAQYSGLRELWQRFRWVLLLIGVTFGGVITRFFAIGMFQ